MTAPAATAAPPTLAAREIDPTFPLRLAGDTHFQRVAALLHAAPFHESALLQALQIERLSEVDAAARRDPAAAALPPLQRLLVRLFLFAHSLPRGEVEAVLDPEARRSLLALDLLRCGRLAGRDGDWCFAPVILYPVAGYFVASDRHDSPDGSPFVAPPDVVFPAIFAGTLRFLELLPDQRGGDALDLGAGSGAGAFALARGAARAVALDVTERASHFARFNARLNGLDNVEVVRGDLYVPLAGRQFDCIVSHPPYVPASDDAMIYRDGGATGERLVRRIVEGLPTHLRPGGRALVVCLGIDTTTDPFERRVVQWLGDSAAEFDVIFAVRQEQAPEDITASIASRARLDAPGLTRLRECLAALGATRMAYGALSLTRRPHGAGPPHGPTAQPARVRLGDQTTAEDLTAAHRWRHHRAAPDLANRAASLVPRLAPTLRLEATYAVEDGRLVLAGTIARCERPFPSATAVPPWVAVLLGFVDGRRTFAECLAAASATGQLPDDASGSDAGALALELIERGCLEVDAPDASFLGTT